MIGCPLRVLEALPQLLPGHPGLRRLLLLLFEPPHLLRSIPPSQMRPARYPPLLQSAVPAKRAHRRIPGTRSSQQRSPLATTATTATLHTNFGRIRLNLFPNHAPKTVRNFVELALGRREYIDPRAGAAGVRAVLRRHDHAPGDRRIHDPEGDPTGTGRGGPGYTFDDEFHPELTFDRRTCWPWPTPDRRPTARSSSSPCPPPAPELQHTIFGEVADEESARVVSAIATTPTDRNDRPLNDVVLERVEIG